MSLSRLHARKSKYMNTGIRRQQTYHTLTMYVNTCTQTCHLSDVSLYVHMCKYIDTDMYRQQTLEVSSGPNLARARARPVPNES